MKKNQTHAAAGGVLRKQLAARQDQLTKQIDALSVTKEWKPGLDVRLKNAIERFRWFICGTFGVKRETVTDKHVALLARKAVRDFSFMYRNFNGIGFTTQERLEEWAKDVR